MNPDQAKNRLIATMVGGLLVPRIEEIFHVKLTAEDVAALITAVPLAYHTAGALWAKAVAAFVMYFPPKVAPAQPAKEPA